MQTLMQSEQYQPEAAGCLRRAIERSRLPHGLIIASPGDVGEEALVQQLATFLLCENPPEAMLPCGECRNCRLIAAGNNPDLFEVRPKGLLRAIKTEDMLGLIQALQATSLSGIGKVGIVYQAETLRKESANRFLKTLEEPTRNTYFILVTTRPERLLPTIRSRCQLIRLLPLRPDVLKARAETELGLMGDTLRFVCALSRGRWRRAVQLAASAEQYQADMQEVSAILLHREGASGLAVEYAQRKATEQKNARKDYEDRVKQELSAKADELKDLDASIRRSILNELEEQLKSEQAARERDSKAGIFEALLDIWRDVWIVKCSGETSGVLHTFLESKIEALAQQYNEYEILRNIADIELVRGPTVYLNARFDIVLQGLLAHITSEVEPLVPLRGAITATGL